MKAGRCSSVSGASSTFDGNGRRANSCGVGGLGFGSETGVGTLDVASGVTAADDRGLFLDRGLDGACRKSSGISFQLSIALGVGVDVDGTRGGAEVDFGGGGGRFTAGGADGAGLGGSSSCLAALGFFSQLDIEDCIASAVVVVEVWCYCCIKW